ncbi:serine hydroxymethyltransferase [Streptomyces sp. NPDC048612]|uniref:serine hydroxymethyltransferase n=1 Tax=Streptomyces sp. NPDC048612 TaxID=3365579 RepID=UPI0037183E98
MTDLFDATPTGPEPRLPAAASAAAVEQLAADRAKALFGAEYAQVWHRTGDEAVSAVLSALLAPGDTVLAPDLAPAAGPERPAHTAPLSERYELATYQVRPSDFTVDMDQVHRLAVRRRPKMILAGWAAYPRLLDYARFRRIADEAGALLLVDMANVAGPVAAGLHPGPVPHAHVVTTGSHPVLGGAVLTGDPRIAHRLDAVALPDRETEAFAHGMAAKAAAFRCAAVPAFREQQAAGLRAARIMAGRLLADDVAETGARVLTGSTETDRVLVDLRSTGLDVCAAAEALRSLGITVERTTLSLNSGTSTASSGVSVGADALAARGCGEAGFRAAAEAVARVLTHHPGERVPTRRPGRAVAPADTTPTPPSPEKSTP